MREDILIVLNEREPLKQQMASILAEQLESRSLSHERLKPSGSLAAIVAERMPRVLIVDYLLGDEGTALDVLSQLRELERPVRTIVWTDERSVSVAVTAMKLGAFEYLELSGAKDIDKILETIERCLSEDERENPRPTTKRGTSPTQGERPIGQAPKSKACFGEAESVAKQRLPVAVLLGEPGTGRSMLGKYIHGCRREAGSFIELQLENWSGAPAEIFGGAGSGRTPPLLSAASTVLIEHAEFDSDGELAEVFVRERSRIFSRADGSTAPLLLVGTSSPETAAVWERLADARVIRIPALFERREDILPLIQRFLAEAKLLSSINKLEIGPRLIGALEETDWPGNVRQLRCCLLDAVTTPLEALKEQAAAENRPDENDQQLVIGAIFRAKDQFENAARPLLIPPPPLLARAAVDAAGGNVRVAAARLGVGVPQLRSALRQPEHRLNGGSR